MSIVSKNTSTSVAAMTAIHGSSLHRDRAEWMQPEAAAAYVDSSTSTLAKLRLRGGGPVFCRIGRAIRYRRSDLDKWLLATSRSSTSDTGAK